MLDRISFFLGGGEGRFGSCADFDRCGRSESNSLHVMDLEQRCAHGSASCTMRRGASEDSVLRLLVITCGCYHISLYLTANVLLFLVVLFANKQEEALSHCA